MHVQAIAAVLSVNSQLPVPDALFPVEGRSRLPDPAHVLVPIRDLRVRVFLLSQRINFFVACDGENPSRRACARWIKQMRLMPNGGHHFLNAFFCHGVVGSRFHQETLHLGRKMVKQPLKSFDAFLASHQFNFICPTCNIIPFSLVTD